jgi:hypothetical protein
LKLPEHMRIGRNAPNERVSLARSDDKKNLSLGAIRNGISLIKQILLPISICCFYKKKIPLHSMVQGDFQGIKSS